MGVGHSTKWIEVTVTSRKEPRAKRKVPKPNGDNSTLGIKKYGEGSMSYTR